MEMPSVRNILHNDTGEMLNSYSTAEAPMKYCATIWEESFAKINKTLSPSPLMGEEEDEGEGE